MKKKFKFLVKTVLFVDFICFQSFLYSQIKEEVAYKKIDSINLKMEVYKSDSDNIKHPAIVFFHGGGWNQRNIDQFRPHADYFSKRGAVCFLVNYRVKDIHDSTPFEALEDAKSAIRFIKESAQRYNLDSSKVVAAGGSAGGQLVAAAALIESFNSKYDNLSISCKPNALVLFNPVVDNGPGGYGHQIIGNEYKDFSPLHNINYGAPPTIIFQGTEDDIVPISTVKYYKTVMDKIDSRCDLEIYPGASHGFFNFKNKKNYNSTIQKMDAFLKSIGILN